MSAPPPLFSDWIGRKEEAATDTITPRLMSQFWATFDPYLADIPNVPLCLHWCLSPPAIPSSGLGDDGHPAKGGFLPPVPLPRRMWASGDVHFLFPLQPGDHVGRKSEIKSVTPKSGKSGELCFVTVENTYTTDAGTAIRETQNIVYREATTRSASAPVPVLVKEQFDTTTHVEITSTMLFRYSALTFNAHRIHYDLPYAQKVESYPDLVIHGPLQATLLLNTVVSAVGELPRRFSFKAVAAATGPQSLQIGLKRRQNTHALSMLDTHGKKTMDAVVEW